MSKIPATDIDQGGLELNLSQVLNPLGGGTSPMSISEAATNNSIQPISSGAVFNALKVNTHTCLINAATIDTTQGGGVEVFSSGSVVFVNIDVCFKSGYPLDSWQPTLIATQLPLPLVERVKFMLFSQLETPQTAGCIIENNGYLSVQPYGQTNLHKGTWYRGSVTYIKASTSS